MADRDAYERREQLELFSNEIADKLLEKSGIPQGVCVIPENAISIWQALSLHRIAEALERQVALLQDEIYPTLEVLAGERRSRK